MRIFFGITGQLGYGGLVQQSVALVKYLRELGCEVLPLVGLAPPHNDEVDPEELNYIFDGFNIADYVLRDKPLFMRWLLSWYGRHQVAKADPHKLKLPSRRSFRISADPSRVLKNLIYRPHRRDVEKVNRLRREFAPDIDYACELSMSGYFGMLEDLGIPLVSAAQGYEICLRYGVDLVPIIRANSDRIHAVISGSQSNVRENVARDLPFMLPKTHVIHYGIVDDEAYSIDIEEARRRTRGFVEDSDDFIVTTLGRMDVEKGIDLALHAIRILLNEGVPVRLRVVGDWPMNDHYYPTLQSKINMMDLHDRVDFIGFVADKVDKVALLKTSDAMLATFIKSEPFGLVLCEAMGAGIPVIAPHTGAAEEILRWNDYNCGLIYRTHDTGQMADRIRYLVEHPEVGIAMGRDGRRAVKERFNARRMARDTLDLFERVLHDRQRDHRSVHVVSTTR
ncbi:MAG: glycosyltransferase family 4 protein [Chloroflexi bacterium]|nr:glycosyltransferase family 4 protein [Chloroflexota bacterium]